MSGCGYRFWRALAGTHSSEVIAQIGFAVPEGVGGKPQPRRRLEY